jgi:hypothetical protein
LYVAGAALVLTSIFSSISIHQTSSALETSRQTLQLSIEPVISVDFPDKTYGPNIIIQNTGTVEIADVRIYPNCYFIKKPNEVFQIIDRKPLESFTLTESVLKPGQKSSIPLKSASCANLPKNSSDYVNSLVIVFHRRVDNKRFVIVEPFMMSEDEPNPQWASPFFAESEWGGDPAFTIGLIEKIRATENVLFRAKE